MNVKLSQMPDVLERLKKANEIRYQLFKQQTDENIARSLRQSICPPEPIKDIPTLQKGIYHPISPMLEVRLRYAGRWTNAIYGNAFLSLSEMENAWNDASIIEQLKIRQDNWETSPPATHPWSQISLFGISTLEYEEIYVVWSEASEPAVVSYVSNYEEHFTSLGDFLLFYCATE